MSQRSHNPRRGKSWRTRCGRQGRARGTSAIVAPPNAPKNQAESGNLVTRARARLAEKQCLPGTARKGAPSPLSHESETEMASESVLTSPSRERHHVKQTKPYPRRTARTRTTDSECRTPCRAGPMPCRRVCQRGALRLELLPIASRTLIIAKLSQNSVKLALEVRRGVLRRRSLPA